MSVELIPLLQACEDVLADRLATHRRAIDRASAAGREPHVNDFLLADRAEYLRAQVRASIVAVHGLSEACVIARRAIPLPIGSDVSRTHVQVVARDRIDRAMQSCGFEVES